MIFQAIEDFTLCGVSRVFFSFIITACFHWGDDVFPSRMLLFKIKEDMAIQLKYRYYTQSAADFYYYALVDDEGPGIDASDVAGSPADLEYASADYRLGNLGAHAVGVKLSTYFLGREARVDFRVEGIINRDKKNRFETVRALVVQLAGKIRF